jgi:hypothetical protein
VTDDAHPLSALGEEEGGKHSYEVDDELAEPK